METEIMNAISQVGFPIFVAVYMLVKGSKDTEKMIEALNSLESTVAVLRDKLVGAGK